MTDMRNKLPIGAHLDSGGCARKRASSQTISLNGQTSGSLNIGNASMVRIQPWTRTSGDLAILISFAGSVNLSRFERVLADCETAIDSVPPNSTLYWGCYNTGVPVPQAGGQHDYLLVTLYE